MKRNVNDVLVWKDNVNELLVQWHDRLKELRRTHPVQDRTNRLYCLIIYPWINAKESIFVENLKLKHPSTGVWDFGVYKSNTKNAEPLVISGPTKESLMPPNAERGIRILVKHGFRWMIKPRIRREFHDGEIQAKDNLMYFLDKLMKTMDSVDYTEIQSGYDWFNERREQALHNGDDNVKEEDERAIQSCSESRGQFEQEYVDSALRNFTGWWENFKQKKARTR